ncbi:glycine C-acetyltransferase [Crossiella equi]|uniref:8-amino-7-oxononanoate synthase n=1 Tax=Crossiella equi TaxID=130796 RepID=A0ABS5AGN6_9PSEU|nr:aminotransferase class I/II-fold pyridoxal phosphate-dependent enzyme [Crossiella equi]MBP2475442.1 glycine C-acetyltransferase [Crossiella equi]
MTRALDRKLARFTARKDGYEGFYFPTVHSAAGARVTMRNQDMAAPATFHNFTSSSYLGLGVRPEVKAAAAEVTERYGIGAVASPAFSGHYDVHAELEREIADLHGVEAAMLFSSGFSANAGAIPALVGRGDVVVLDASAHGSLKFGAQASGAEVVEYPHRDLDALEDVLRQRSGGRGSLLLGAMGVYSMSGDSERIDRIAELAQRYGAFLMLDDAHGLGVLGHGGLGSVQACGLAPEAVDVHMGTLSKAIASCGGYIAGSRQLVEFLRTGAMSHVLATAMPPSVAAGSLAALRILRAEGAGLVADLRRKCELFRAELRAGGCEVGGDAAVVPVYAGSDELTMSLGRELLAREVFVSPAVFPGVARGRGRLRFSLSTAHGEDQLRHVAQVVSQLVVAD